MSEPNFDFSPLLEYSEKNNIFIPENTVENLTLYGKLLLQWNEKINLTAIKEPEEIVVKHFIDSLSLLKIIDPKPGEALIDIGTGAGFPGMVIKILRPDVKVTLLDGHAKRFIFLEDLQQQLNIKTENLHIRAELAAKDLKYREMFDYATARAVARLNTLSEYCLPFVKKDGIFVSYKSETLEEEVINATNAIQILGGRIMNKYSFYLPGTDIYRTLCFIEKVDSTPDKYPRKAGLPSKKPL